MRFDWGSIEESDARDAPASHDWTGTRFVWRALGMNGAHFALDVERLDTPLEDSAMITSLAPADFLSAWTRHEVLAKLQHEPILSRLRSRPLIVPVAGEVTEVREAGRTFRLLTAHWPERQLVFTCGYRSDDFLTPE